MGWKGVEGSETHFSARDRVGVMSPNPRLVPVESRLKGRQDPLRSVVSRNGPVSPVARVETSGGCHAPPCPGVQGGSTPMLAVYWVRGNPEVLLGRNDGMAGSHTVGLPEEGPVRKLAHTVGPDKRDMELWADTVSPSGRAAPVSWMES